MSVPMAVSVAVSALMPAVIAPAGFSISASEPRRIMPPALLGHAEDGLRNRPHVDHGKRTAVRAGAIPIAVIAQVPVSAIAERVLVVIPALDHVDPRARLVYDFGRTHEHHPRGWGRATDADLEPEIGARGRRRRPCNQQSERREAEY